MLKNLIFVAAAMLSMIVDGYAQDNLYARKNSVLVADYDFQQKEYKKCMEQSVSYTAQEYVACLNAEIARQNAAIEAYYNSLLKYPEFQKWNNGNGMFRGNMKDMNDQFVAYRERLCSLSGMALYQLNGDLEYGRKECVKDVNEELLRRLERMYNSSQADFGPDVYNGETY